MTVADLIKELQVLPPDAVVIHSNGSDWYEVEGLVLHPAEKKTMVYRNGKFSTYIDRWFPPNEKPDFRTVVELE